MAMRRWRCRPLSIVGWLLLLFGLMSLGAGAARAQSPTVYVLQARGVVNQAMAGYIERGIDAAEEAGAAAVLIELDTPGGALEATREIMQRFNAARVPVIVYVAPAGARAGSAGVFLTMSAHVAAMAPTTNIGAAHPVDSNGKDIEGTLNEKITNDAVAMIRGQALRHGRNADWAEESVRKSVSITSDEALERKVIDAVAPSREDLLNQLDGRRVKLAGGETVLHTAGARLETVGKSLQEEFLDLIGNPNVALLLMVLGFNALIYELANPGLIFPGVVGAIAMLLGLYGVGTLSPNWAGLLLIGLAFFLFIVEVKVQSHGLLAAGAIASMLLGGALLTASNPPWARISWVTIFFVTAWTSAIFLFIVGAAVRALHRPVRVGPEAMIGLRGQARSDLRPNGMIFVDGAHWEATAIDGPISSGERVEVAGRHGLRLYVRRAA